MPQKIEGEVYLTVPEIAECLHVNQETVRKWIRARKLNSRLLGRQHYVLERDVEAFLDARER